MECEHKLIVNRDGTAHCEKCGQQAKFAAHGFFADEVETGFRFDLVASDPRAVFFQVHCLECGAYFGHENEIVARRLFDDHRRSRHISLADAVMDDARAELDLRDPPQIMPFRAWYDKRADDVKKAIDYYKSIRRPWTPEESEMVSRWEAELSFP